MPGNSVKNKVWGELMFAHYAPNFDSVFMLEYDHWVSGEPNLNFEVEAQRLQAHVDSLTAGTEITLFAKSAGSLLGLMVMHNKILKPVCGIFWHAT